MSNMRYNPADDKVIHSALRMIKQLVDPSTSQDYILTFIKDVLAGRESTSKMILELYYLVGHNENLRCLPNSQEVLEIKDALEIKHNSDKLTAVELLFLGLFYLDYMRYQDSKKEENKICLEKCTYYLKLADELGELNATALLGKILIDSNDIKSGVKLIQKAAENKNGPGLFQLATCYFNGIGMKVNCEQGIKALEEAHDDPLALTALGIVYSPALRQLDIALNGINFDKIKNDQENDKATECLEKAAILGYSSALSMLAHLCYHKKQHDRAATLFRYALETFPDLYLRSNMHTAWPISSLCTIINAQPSPTVLLQASIADYITKHQPNRNYEIQSLIVDSLDEIALKDPNTFDELLLSDAYGFNILTTDLLTTKTREIVFKRIQNHLSAMRYELMQIANLANSVAALIQSYTLEDPQFLNGISLDEKDRKKMFQEKLASAYLEDLYLSIFGLDSATIYMAKFSPWINTEQDLTTKVASNAEEDNSISKSPKMISGYGANIHNLFNKPVIMQNIFECLDKSDAEHFANATIKPIRLAK